MRLNIRNEEPDERNEVLGLILRKAVESAAGQCPAEFPVHTTLPMMAPGVTAVSISSSLPHDKKIHRLAVAAAVIAFLGGSTITAFGIVGRESIRSSSLEVARSIMPERSFWVQASLSGEVPFASAVSDFIEGLWSSETDPEGLRQFF